MIYFINSYEEFYKLYKDRKNEYSENDVLCIFYDTDLLLKTGISNRKVFDSKSDFKNINYPVVVAESYDSESSGPALVLRVLTEEEIENKFKATQREYAELMYYFELKKKKKR